MNTNHGSDTQEIVKNGATDDVDRQAYLKFDISSLPTTVANAKLRLYGALNTAGDTVGFTINNVPTTTWSESTITWANKPSNDSTALATGSVSSTTNQWYEFDLTTYINNAKAAGQSTISLAVLPTSTVTATGFFFNSKENTGGNGPQLTYG